MADEPPPLPVYHVPYLRLFPWLRLFRALGVSIDAKKLILAALGLFLFHLGRGGIDRLLPTPAGRPASIAPLSPEPPDPAGGAGNANDQNGAYGPSGNTPPVGD